MWLIVNRPIFLLRFEKGIILNDKSLKLNGDLKILYYQQKTKINQVISLDQYSI